MRSISTTTTVSRWCLSSALAFPIIAQGADWPQWRGPRQDGATAENGWLATWPGAGPRTLWEGVVGAGHSSVAVCDGRVYTLATRSHPGAGRRPHLLPRCVGTAGLHRCVGQIERRRPAILHWFSSWAGRGGNAVT
jgi:hypothetical protein